MRKAICVLLAFVSMVFVSDGGARPAKGLEVNELQLQFIPGDALGSVTKKDIRTGSIVRTKDEKLIRFYSEAIQAPKTRSKEGHLYIGRIRPTGSNGQDIWITSDGRAFDGKTAIQISKEKVFLITKSIYVLLEGRDSEE